MFAIAALLLAATGIYGVLANITQRRTQEIGVRRALGIPDAAVLRMLIKQGGILCLIGLLIGLPAAWFMSNIFIGLMGSESSSYKLMFGFVPALITMVVLIATWVPANKALKMEPGMALRYE